MLNKKVSWRDTNAFSEINNNLQIVVPAVFYKTKLLYKFFERNECSAFSINQISALSRFGYFEITYKRQKVLSIIMISYFLLSYIYLWCLIWLYMQCIGLLTHMCMENKIWYILSSEDKDTYQIYRNKICPS